MTWTEEDLETKLAGCLSGCATIVASGRPLRSVSRYLADNHWLTTLSSSQELFQLFDLALAFSMSVRAAGRSTGSRGDRRCRQDAPARAARISSHACRSRPWSGRVSVRVEDSQKATAEAPRDIREARRSWTRLEARRRILNQLDLPAARTDMEKAERQIEKLESSWDDERVVSQWLSARYRETLSAVDRSDDRRATAKATSELCFGVLLRPGHPDQQQPSITLPIVVVNGPAEPWDSWC